MTNRSAKGGARSSLHYSGEGILAAAASARFANRCGDLVTGPTVGGGAR